MTTLDARARSAAHAVNAGVAEFTPAAAFATVVVRQQRWRTFQAAFTGAMAAAIIVIIGLMATPSPGPEVADVPITAVEPTIPAPEPEVAPPPVVVPTTQAPATTTTTTSTTTPTTTAPVVAPPTTEPERDTTPPPLTITKPTNDQHFETDVIEFRGTTEPGATVAAGQYLADVDREGNWSIVLILSPGANGARFVATDAAGNQTTAGVTVHYDVPETTEPPPKDPPREEIGFTAHSVYGSCEENPPYDVYWGTAPPGTPISIESEYGSGVTEANANGDWEIRVYFPEAPFEKEFTVKAKDDKGNKKTFGFIRFG